MTNRKAKPLSKNKVLIILAALLLITGGALLWFRLSPAPGAAVIRVVFDKGAADTKAEMEKVVGNVDGITVHSDINYSKGEKDALLDIYTPLGARNLPIVLWTHGGAWLSGDKADATPYFKKLAKEGFVVVAPNYSLAPSKAYPTQIQQLSKVHEYINKNAELFNGDNTRIILAGDSAGAQISAQLAAMLTNPDYAKEVGVQPVFKPSQIAATVLYCGIFKMEVLAEPAPTLSKILSWGNRITVWSLMGSRDMTSPIIRQASPYYHVNKDFPDSFISGGNADPLTKVQSEPFAEKLKSQGVDITTLFYTNNHTPAQAHENQFILDKDGLLNFEAMLAFLKEKTTL